MKHPLITPGLPQFLVYNLAIAISTTFFHYASALQPASVSISMPLHLASAGFLVSISQTHAVSSCQSGAIDPFGTCPSFRALFLCSIKPCNASSGTVLQTIATLSEDHLV